MLYRLNVFVTKFWFRLLNQIKIFINYVCIFQRPFQLAALCEFPNVRKPMPDNSYFTSEFFIFAILLNASV